MFNSLRRTLGLIKVEQTRDEIKFSGTDTEAIYKDIIAQWGSVKIPAGLFKRASSNSFSVHLFYGIEMQFILTHLINTKRIRSSKRALKSALEGLLENTWVKQTHATDNEPIFNRKKLSLFKWTPLDHQAEFFDICDLRVRAFGLKGYMLGAIPGSGKTFTSMATAEMVEADTIIVVSPKNAVDRVWRDTIDEVYKTPVSRWVVSEGKEPEKGMHYYVFHYEYLAHFLAFAKKNKASMGKVAIILDESHNFNLNNKEGSARSRFFEELVKETDSIWTLWMSGTPFKAMGSEAIPLFRSIDPLFTPEVEKGFMQIFGKNARRALSILAHRIGLVVYTVPEEKVYSTKPTIRRLDAPLKDSKKYTLPAVRVEMEKFIKERSEYYKSQMKELVRAYHECVAWFEKNGVYNAAAFKEYKKLAERLHTRFSIEDKEAITGTNKYEREEMLPQMSPEMKKVFKDTKSVYKYVSLKIQGEALGRILGQLRTECNLSLAQAVLEGGQEVKVDGTEMTTIDEIVNAAASKSVFFTSFVQVADFIFDHYKSQKKEPLVVHGGTNKNLTNIIKTFDEKPEVNPLVATFQSLSTAVPLIMANTMFFMNMPFRDYIRIQTVARMARLGQQHPVYVYDLFLDTGKEPNISTRSNDIMEWSREQVDAIMGRKSSGIDATSMESFMDEAAEGEPYDEEDVKVALANLGMESYADNITYSYMDARYGSGIPQDTPPKVVDIKSDKYSIGW